MKLEGLNLYLENLLPGIVILGSLLILVHPPQSTNVFALEITKSEFLLSVFFLSIAYMLGVISAVISRLFSIISDELTRPIMQKLFTQIPYDELKTALSLQEEKNWRKRWHKAYRAAVAYQINEGKPEVRNEVIKRREQARLIRNLFFPLVFGAAAFSQLFQTRNAWILISTVGVASILLFSYAEYTTFAEAILPFATGTARKSKH
jgi:hypothetical protein